LHRCLELAYLALQPFDLAFLRDEFPQELLVRLGTLRDDLE
jgi:hypothetical protein